MERKVPNIGEIYRHFKGNLYQIIANAKHSETREDMVVYQALYPPFGVWVRPLSMFMEKVDREKYPEVEQSYRFEHITYGDEENIISDNIVEETVLPINEKIMSVQDMEQMIYKALLSGNPERTLGGRMSKEDIAEKGFMQLLDAPTFREKKQLLQGLHPYLNERWLHNIAVALDIGLEEGDEESYYQQILYCLTTFEHYEGSRLR